MAETMTYSETLVVTHCWCGIAVAIPANLHRVMNDEGQKCYCPIGHTFVYGNTFKEQLQQAEQRVAEEQRRVRATRDLLHAEERSHVATKGHLTRVKKRVQHGVCPHCNRSFQDLRRHMRSKHKEEIKETASA
jgi:hypothetical protein